MYYSYKRVSTDKQDLLRQETAIQEFCISNNITLDAVYSDKITGKVFHRPDYDKLKSVVKKGDTVIIKELDRLGRDWDGIKNEWKWFDDNDINVIVIDMPLLAQSIYDEKGEINLNMKFVKTIVFETLCYVSETERRKICRRTSESLQAKKKQGMVLGRPKNLEVEQKVFELVAEGKSKIEIAETLNISRASVYQILKRQQTV